MKLFNFKQNHIQELLENNFCMMVIPTAPIFNGVNQIKLKYPYPDHKYICTKEDYTYTTFDTSYYLKCMKEDKMIIFELKEVGSLIFTNHICSSIFSNLQRDYREYINYVFMANKKGGYFKILKNGVIQRKIASNLIIDGIKNYPETRGLPCEYELEHNRVWKIDKKAKYMKDMIKDFTSKEVLELFDYYIGLSKINNENIVDVMIYKIESYE